jgi:hypothetical protein
MGETLVLETETKRPNLEQMTEGEKSAYFAQIEHWISVEKRSDGWIQRELGISRATARRHLALVKGRMGSIGPPIKAVVIDNDAYAPVAARAIPVAATKEKQPLKGGRLTTTSGGYRLNQVIPQPEAGDWRLENVTSDELRRMSPADLIARMIRISPEISRAYFDFLRMANPGHELKAVNPGTDIPNEPAQEWLNFFEKVLADRNNRGSADVVYNQMLTNLWVRGALFCELVLAKDARSFADIVVPDAYSARFKVVKDEEIGGQRFQLVQGTGRDEVVLDRITIRYIPVDPLPDTPYGTSPVAPGLFPAIFLITMLQDARRVVAQQGWPRLNIMVKVAEIIATMRPEDQKKPEVVKAYVTQAVNEIAASYSDLDPDQAWVHSDTVEFGAPIGAIGNLEGIGSLISVLERMCVRALKSQPLLFGMPEGVSEANANRQWEVHVQGIQALQSLCSAALSSLFTLALEAQGIAAEARFSFKELRAIEDLRDAQAMFQRLTNSQLAEVLGYMEHDEASIYYVGHPAAATPIGVVGDEEDQPPPGEDDGSTANPQGGKVGAGDDSDDDISGDDGANRLARRNDAISDASFRTLVSVLGNPDTAIGVAYAMQILSGRLVPKMEPKGKPEATGKENIRVDKSDLREAIRDFDYRVPDEFDGILEATIAD